MSVINATPLLAAAGGDYQISRSVRLRSSASAYFNRTPASAGNRKTWTWSGWVKVGTLGVNRGLFGAQTTAGNDNNRLLVWLNSSNKIIVYEDIAGTGNTYRLTTQVFRDPSAWYHVVLAFDTSNATAADRVKLYVNGSQITAFDTNNAPTLNRDTFVNATLSHSLGADRASSLVVFDGYLTEVNFIDGQALTPSSFGETDSITGVWKPKKYTGTYGTNGFYLNFSDNSAATAAAIGKDYSGNGNNWTPNNISVTAGVTYDSMIDVPTLFADGGNGRGNYAVMAPTDTTGGLTLTEGNLRVASTVAQTGGSRGTIGVSSGKWYWEMTANVTTSGIIQVGVAGSNSPNQVNPTLYAVYINFNGNAQTPSGSSAYGATYTTGDVIGIALDMDAGTLVFYKNNASQGTAATGLTGSYSPWVQDGGGDRAMDAYFNFGQRPFAYTPPTGFKALNTQNLPEPTIKKGNQYFDASLWTGTGSAQSIANSGGFAPDLVWTKSRSNAYGHKLYDVPRGAGVILSSNSTSAESTDTNTLSAFTSTGFSLGTDAGINGSGSTFVGWQWKANGTGVSNTDGSITSTVSANTTAGFSIVTYTGTGANATVGLGLGVAPKMVIVKPRTPTSTSDNWEVYHASLGNGQFLTLNSTAAAVTAANRWNNTSPTSTVFSIGTVPSSSADDYVAYCFAEVAGFSRFGSYTGNGSTDGPFVFCGFRPAFVMVKRTDSTSDWYSRDSTRDTYNPINNTLFPNTSAAEEGWAGAYPLDLTSNGFKLRTSVAGFNASGGTFIYMAFAENPFKNSLAR